MNYIKFIVVGIVCVALGAVAGYTLAPTQPVLGAIDPTTFTNPIRFSSTVRINSSGTTFTRVNGGTCYIKPYAATVPASTTAQVDCQATAGWNASGASALTGITYGDSIVATLATSTAGLTSTVGQGMSISGVAASSTAGYITMFIANQTGATFTWPVTGVASGTAYYVAVK